MTGLFHFSKLSLPMLALGLDGQGRQIDDGERERAITLHLALWDCRWAVDPATYRNNTTKQIDTNLEKQIATRYHAIKRKERRE